MGIELGSGEGMREALHRASLWNGFPRPSVIIDLAGCTSVRKVSALATCDNRRDIAKLAQILSLAPDVQERLLREKLPVHASRDFVMFFGHAVRRGHISNARRIAPQMLAQGERLKAIWSLKPLALDPVSREYLCDRCPCGALLGWELSCDAWTCDQCGADLRDAPVKIYNPRNEKALDFAARLIDPESSERNSSLPAGSELADERAGDLFQLIVRIAQTCQRIEAADARKAIEPHNIERAGRAVLDWPNGFEELVDSIIAPTSESRELGWFDSKPLRRLQFDQTLPATIRTRIKGLLDSARRIEAVNSQGVTPSRFVYPSKVGDTNRLKRPREDVLTLVRSRGKKVDGRFAPSAHFNPYMTAMRDIGTVRRFSEDMGLPMPAVWELLNRGMAPELATDIAHLGPVPLPTVESSLIADVSKIIRPGTRIGALGLVSCCFALDPSMGFSWSSILRAVLDGQLEVWRGRRRKRGLMSELVVTDFSFLRSLVETQPTSDDVRNAPMSHREVSMTIDRTKSVAANIVNSGLMQGISTAEKLAQLRKSWAFSFELQTLAGMSRRPIKDLYRKLRNVDVKCMRSGDVIFWRRDEALSCLGLQLS
ncbi:hypothetical protein CO657_10995 [Rhizobium acidisoli]|uniref:TniQ protein n=1 Tax=Rhizobium acidisoli TaxID=1538158 RepID=A0AAE5TVZ0_9HYPH|nr:hypothetical protein [Rhizobium acidisoli]QAS78565.1 hypothetical protein CO657_10995 [Rhizobium acidisoli]